MTTQVQWQVLKAASGWRVGQTATVELGEEIPGDGLGELFRVRHSGGHQRLALRFVQGAREAWIARAATLTPLGHPTVLPLLGVGELAGRTFLVEERHEGESLRVWLAKQRSGAGAELGDVHAVMRDVLSAVGHAHSGGVYHGALSAECVSIARDGVGNFDLRVGAFGILSGIRERRATLSAQLWDTLAPELTQEATPPIAASDLYALGVMFVECLTGSLHPRGTRHAWREVGVRHDELRERLGAERDDVPDALWDVAAGLLTDDPSQRKPRSTRDLEKLFRSQSWEPKVVVAPTPRPAAPQFAAPPPVAYDPGAARVVSVSTVRVAMPAAPTPAEVPAEPDAPPRAVRQAERVFDATLTDDAPPAFESPLPSSRPSRPSATIVSPAGAALAAQRVAVEEPPKFSRDATLVDDHVPEHVEPVAPQRPAAGAGRTTGAYEDDDALLAAGANARAARAKAHGQTQQITPVARVPLSAERAVTQELPHAPVASSVPPSMRPIAPVAAGPAARAAPADVARTLDEDPQLVRTPPRRRPAPSTEHLEAPGLGTRAQVGIALVALLVMGALGWLFASMGHGR